MKLYNVLKVALLFVVMLLAACAAPVIPVAPAAAPEPPEQTTEEPGEPEQYTLRIWYPASFKPLFKNFEGGEFVTRYLEKQAGMVVLEPTPISDDVFVSTVVGEMLQGTAPDVLIGDHMIGAGLVNTGLLDAYCASEEDCGVCSSENPPEWCQYAQGMLESRITQPLAGYCVEGGCPECDSATPPPWCVLARTNPDIDVLNATTWLDADERPFPYGIPVYWNYQVPLINVAWFEERELPIPSTTPELGEVTQAYPEAVYYEDNIFFPQAGITHGEEYFPTENNINLFTEAGYGDWSQTGVLIARVSSLPLHALRYGDAFNETARVLSLPDYTPNLFVTAAYAPEGPNRELAIDFVYDLAEQSYLFNTEPDLELPALLLPADEGSLVQLQEVILATDAYPFLQVSENLQSILATGAIGGPFPALAGSAVFADESWTWNDFAHEAGKEAVTGAVSGAVAGAVVGSPVGAAEGAAVGAVAGAVSGAAGYAYDYFFGSEFLEMYGSLYDTLPTAALD